MDFLSKCFFIFCFSSSFVFCLSPFQSSSSQSESSVFRFGVDCAQMGHCGPHPHNSSNGTFGNDFLFWDILPRTIGWGIAAWFGGALSASGLFPILMKAGIRISFPFDGIGHDLAKNKFVEARTVLDHGISSLVGGMVDVAVAGALSCRGVGCCSIKELLRLGINGTSPPWGFCIEELGTFCSCSSSSSFWQRLLNLPYLKLHSNGYLAPLLLLFVYGLFRDWCLQQWSGSNSLVTTWAWLTSTLPFNSK